ncbi:MAG: response regulator [Mucilaginibacter polytrichastri]|nr:response regulator [Mucilaginibacter polytrichastri]
MKNALARNLQLGFGLSLLLLIASSVLSYLSIENLLKSSEMVDHSHQVVSRLERTLSIMKDAETGQRGYLLTGRDEFLTPYTGARQQALREVDILLNDTKDNPEQVRLMRQMRFLISERMSILKEVLEKKQAGKNVTIDDLRRGKSAMDKLRQAVSRAEVVESNLLQLRVATMKRFSSFTPIIIIIAAVLAISLSIFSYIRVTSDMAERMRLQNALVEKDRETARRIGIIRSIATRVASGDYTVRVDEQVSDELGNISVALNSMAGALEKSFGELSENEWLQTGISELNTEMLGEKGTSVLAADILQSIVGYTESQLGAFYLSEGKMLNLASGYALADAPKEIPVGEGIAGQAAENKQTIWLKDIGETAVKIRFTAGSITPAHIIALPVRHESGIKGVIEIAAIQPYPARVIQFLETVSESIGIAVTGAQNRKRMQELLEETQAQAEELQAQHSELESLNTELEAHTQKLQTSEEELRVQQEELQHSNQELAERNTIILERNIEVQQKARELEQSTRYKSEFMANMSHELRTPLNSILLLSRYLSENSGANLTAEQVESANVILNSGNGLLTLIDELLDLSKIEAGKMDLDYEQVKPADLLRDMQALFNPVAKEKGLDLEMRNQITDPSVETDKMRLEQILKNLLSNALKFTSKGKVVFEMRNTPARDGFVDFIVSDTGIGIAKDKQAQVFEAFQQADGSTKRKFGGTGLGLSISRQLVLLLGGEISLSSEPGKGSTFLVTLPVQKIASRFGHELPPASEESEPVSPGKNEQEHRYVVPVIPEDIADDRAQVKTGEPVVLIVEDDTAFARILLDYTHKRGYKGIVAVRGDHGIELARQYHPVAILLDIQLPVKDGWQVMDELKSDPVTRPIPVHIMSSLEAKRESRARGAIDFISKPIAIEHMKQMFQKLEDALAKSPKKVLIVEENTKHAEALSYFLSSFQVSSKVSGSITESVDTLLNKEVDCVIMDMGIPDKNAYETMETIKQNPGLENLPIIVFTGKNLSSAEETRIRQYADTIVVKTAHSYQRILDEVALFLHLIEENKENERPVNRLQNMLNEVLQGKTVLIADDDVRNIFSMTKSLEKHGMHVISATDGREALQQLEVHPETAVVLMDMMMPEMDGYESTTKIRQDRRFRNLPVIAVTAKAMVGDREKCIAAGASDYISKPVDVDQLVSLLRVWLYHQES